uniref:Protein FAM84B-like n=1 Tax=Phallusia mammillata TaxID=59560 RepID=A0A6F9DD29_9ASCI|nr:protein FAM84B-like [Phallusia mammillata]
MGNAEAAYKQVSVNDDSVSEDLMFVFHSTEGDCNERVIHDGVDYNKTNPIMYTILMDKRIIAEEKLNEETCTVHSCPRFRPGDAIEVLATPRFWTLYAGDEICVCLHNEEIVRQDIKVAFSDHPLRKVNKVYKLKVLPANQIVEKAQSQVGQKCVWWSSECFVMWCRTGMMEFKEDETLLHVSQPKDFTKMYMLEILHDDGTCTQHDFETLQPLIKFKNENTTNK